MIKLILCACLAFTLCGCAAGVAFRAGKEPPPSGAIKTSMLASDYDGSSWLTAR